MLKYSTKFLMILLAIVSSVSLLNVLVMYWLPIILPFISFSTVRFAAVAFIEKRYYLLAVSILICVLMFLSIISVRRRHIILPSLLLLYLIYDFLLVLSLFIDGLGDGYWKTYIIHIITLISLVSLLCVYCLNWLRYKLCNRH